jgi:transcriptional regulator with XRE-family HTH domain
LIRVKYLAFARRRKHWTQLKLSEEVHISPRYISEFERGFTLPNSELQGRIAAALGVDAEKLLKDVDEVVVVKP